MAICAENIKKELTTQAFGQYLLVYEQVASTNDTARAHAMAGAAEGTTVVAARQTAGRGRRGRQFASPDGGLYMSMVLRPAEGITPGAVTSCCAVAVARAIRRVCGVDVGIKWVNDLYINGRKVCGILAEGVLAPAGGFAYMILGIGINLAHTALPPEVAAIATSLEQAGATTTQPETLIAAILQEWETAYATIATGDYLADSRRLSVVLGQPVTVFRGSDTFQAVAEAIDDEGRLVVRRPEGIDTLESGEVTLRLTP